VPSAERSIASPSSHLTASGVFSGLAGFADYRALYSPGADIDRLGEEFFASVRAQTNGSLVLTKRVLFNVSTRRDVDRVRRNAFDHLTLTFIHSGKLELEADRRCIRVRAGEAVILDTTRPARHSARVEMTTVSLPRRLAPSELSNSPRLHGLRLSVRDAGPLVRWLVEESAGRRAEKTLATALAAALRQTAGADGDSSSDAKRRQDQARQLIESRLEDQDFSPEQLAKRLGVSRATLYRMFEPLGPIDRWRQNRRLLRFKAALAFTDIPIAEAAHLVGLEDAAHASSLFSKSFGLTPSRFRRRAQGGERSAEIDELAWIFETIPVRTLRPRDPAWR
jgi:AraC-like DNA-binding protein